MIPIIQVTQKQRIRKYIQGENTMDFETLKQSSSNFDKLTKAIEANLNPEDKQNNKSKYQDDRFWKPELDKTGKIGRASCRERV